MNTKGINFSVIIPLYNKAPYIERAIRSVLNQSLENFEIIVVDDGSTDNGVEVVEKIIDERIKLIRQKNNGVSAARNKGAENSRYEYLAFLDADDTWESTFLFEVTALIKGYPNAGIYGTNNKFKYPNGKIFYEKFENLFGFETSGVIEDYFGLFADIQKSPFSNSNICIPKKIYDEFEGYKEGVKLTEDSDLWCRIALKYDVAFSKLPLATYYIDLAGSTHSIFQAEEYQVSKTLKKALKDNSVNSKLIHSVKKLIVFQKMSLIKRALIAGNKNYASKALFDSNLALYYPKDFFLCLISLVIPQKAIDKFRKNKM